jgi:hypothetical protein
MVVSIEVAVEVCCCFTVFNTGKLCNCLIQFLLTVVLSTEERVYVSAQRLSERTVLIILQLRQFGNKNFKWLTLNSEILAEIQYRLPCADYYYFLWHCNPAWAMASSSTRFLDHTQRRATVGMTPLDE